jgi:hypothetical protein
MPRARIEEWAHAVFSSKSQPPLAKPRAFIEAVLECDLSVIGRRVHVRSLLSGTNCSLGRKAGRIAGKRRDSEAGSSRGGAEAQRGEGTEASGQKSEDRGQETGHSGAGVDSGAVTSGFEGLLEVVEPRFLLVVHAVDAEIDGFGVEGGGVDAEEAVDEALGGEWDTFGLK